MQKNFASRPNIFRVKPEDFRARQIDALQKRLDRGMTAKTIAYAIGVHGDTFLNWAHGRSTMDGPTIESLDNYFASIGDWGFIGEIYGEIGVRRRRQAIQLEKQAARLRREAKWLSESEAVA